ncbi:MOSC domain [alpha proteobacterium U9-1i]|nr:MOSC domain [alpha proteobacterium U9-1i]
MSGVVEMLTRHPVKGFTPEQMRSVMLTPGAGFPFDRAFAVEDGPSGFNPDAPGHISKTKFTVLAKIPAVACVRTRYDDETGVFHAEAPGVEAIAADLNDGAERERFADWLTTVLRDDIRGPLRVLAAPGAHRFFDHPQGLVSLINLESVRDIERRLGVAVDPLRFRANIYVSGWPAWSELDCENRTVKLAGATARVFKSITRCVATHVDPQTGVRDIEMVEALHREYGHVFCGVYLHVEQGGALKLGDRVEIAT